MDEINEIDEMNGLTSETPIHKEDDLRIAGVFAGKKKSSYRHRSVYNNTLNTVSKVSSKKVISSLKKNHKVTKEPLKSPSDENVRPVRSRRNSYRLIRKRNINISSFKKGERSSKLNLLRRDEPDKNPETAYESQKLGTNKSTMDYVNSSKESIITNKSVCSKREIIMDLLREVCSKYKLWEKLSTDKKEMIIRRIERNCMNKVIIECERNFIDRNWNDKIFLERYSTELYRHLSNLDIDIVSEYYINKLCTGEIDPINAPSLSNYELSPASSEEEREILNKRKEQKIIEKYTDKNPCFKCGSHKVKFQETSGRSLGADEISQFKYTCDNCKSYWIR